MYQALDRQCTSTINLPLAFIPPLLMIWIVLSGSIGSKDEELYMAAHAFSETLDFN